MDHFAGLDVSVKETSVCIVDDAGKVVREVKVTSEPEAFLAVLKNPAYRAPSGSAKGPQFRDLLRIGGSVPHSTTRLLPRSNVRATIE
jgi:hypothetical protein